MDKIIEERIEIQRKQEVLNLIEQSDKNEHLRKEEQYADPYGQQESKVDTKALLYG